LLYALIGMCGFVGFASFAVDFGSAQLAKSQLRAAVDAATLAGGSGMSISPATARARAKAIAASNIVNGAPLTLLDSDIELGTWNASTGQFTVLNGNNESKANAIRVNGLLAAGRGTGVNLAFMGSISNRKTIDLKVSSIGAAAVDAVDLMLVQDVSGSFTNEISIAKTGDTALLNSLNTTGSKSSFGITVFTGTAKTVTSPTGVVNNIGPLRSSLNSLSVGGNGMPAIISGTDIAAGMEKAIAALNSYSSSNNNRTMVIVSDGEPSASLFGAHPFYSANQLLALAQSDADTAWAAGINIYVVFWNSSNDTRAAANLRSLVRGKGTFIDVTDPADLPDAIGLIMQSQTRLVH